MRSLSARDILLALPHLKSEVALIHPKNDAEVFAVLDAVGFDTRQGVEWIVAHHRDMQNNIGVGFIAVGEYNTDPKFKNFIDTTDRIIIAGMLDPSLGRSMEEMMGRRHQYRNEDEQDVKSRKRPNDPRYYSDEELIAMGYTDGEESDDSGEGYVEDSYDAIRSQITALEGVRKQLRGV